MLYNGGGAWTPRTARPGSSSSTISGGRTHGSRPFQPTSLSFRGRGSYGATRPMSAKIVRGAAAHASVAAVAASSSSQWKTRPSSARRAYTPRWKNGRGVEGKRRREKPKIEAEIIMVHRKTLERSRRGEIERGVRDGGGIMNTAKEEGQREEEEQEDSMRGLMRKEDRIIVSSAADHQVRQPQQVGDEQAQRGRPNTLPHRPSLRRKDQYKHQRKAHQKQEQQQKKKKKKKKVMTMTMITNKVEPQESSPRTVEKMTEEEIPMGSLGAWGDEEEDQGGPLEPVRGVEPNKENESTKRIRKKPSKMKRQKREEPEEHEHGGGDHNIDPLPWSRSPRPHHAYSELSVEWTKWRNTLLL